MEEKIDFRFAERKDISLILKFVNELAVYEKMEDQVVADEKIMEDWLFNKRTAEVVFALENGKEVGFALFFYNFSTFLGKSGIYLEDLFVKAEFRGRGYGKGLINFLAKTAIKRGCGRLEWCCLNWNEPSIKFYLSLGAEQMNEWTTYRLAGETLKKAAE